MQGMLNELLKKETKLAVIGLGYVGLPIALAFARKIKVVGFDVNQKRVEMMQNNQDPSGELHPSAFDQTDILITSNVEDLRDCTFFIVAVPTPIDEHNNPDLNPVIKASETLSKVLKKGDYVVYESTVYPGCTEEDCVPILEKSGLKYNTDFKVGFSPERINPGDAFHNLQNTIKIVSGSCEESSEVIYQIYCLVVDAGCHKASSIKVAEAAKIIENTQRDLNIAFMNELSIIFDKMGINTYEVIEAASTKWNFQKYSPGLVGGHCIGVDPYYLTYKANSLGHHAKVILAGREVNDSMGAYIANKIVKLILELKTDLHEARVLMMGVTFKENVKDIRNSKVVDLIRELKSFKINVDVIDPFADNEEVHEEYGFELCQQVKKEYDSVVIAVSHEQFLKYDESYFESILIPNGLVADVKGQFRSKIKKLRYWSL